MRGLVIYFEIFNDAVSNFLWGLPMLTVFFACGIYFSVKTGFFQLRCFPVWLRATLGSLFCGKRQKNNALSPWEAFATALAGTLGTGNIVGVATAIKLGGAGAVFWMWVSALLGMMTSFAERTLGILYRKTNADGSFYGGAVYYIYKALGGKFSAVVYCIFCIGASFGMGGAAQSNAAAAALKSSFGVPCAVTGVFTAVLCGAVILGGIKRIGRVNAIFTPVMSLFYIAGCIICIAINKQYIFSALSAIFKGAFCLKAVGGGAGGYVMLRAVKYGISRGVFSNEAGLGASVTAHCTANVEHPCVQGMWGICEVFVDTIVVCTLTALCILTSPAAQSFGGELAVIAAFKGCMNAAGGCMLSVCITLFALGSVVGWAYYGEQAFSYLGGEKNIFYVVFLLFTALGAVMRLELVWQISDIFNALMAIPNIAALLVLSPEVVESYNNYVKTFLGENKRCSKKCMFKNRSRCLK